MNAARTHFSASLFLFCVRSFGCSSSALAQKVSLVANSEERSSSSSSTKPNIILAAAEASIIIVSEVILYLEVV